MGNPPLVMTELSHSTFVQLSGAPLPTVAHNLLPFCTHLLSESFIH